MITMITKNDLAKYSQQLQEIISEANREDETTRDSRSVVTLDQQSVGRLNRMEAMQQQAMARATYQRRQAQVTRAKSALKRIANSEFGECLECGEEIAAKRLQHDPTLPLCITCASG
ncbi:MAG: TraR/DksA C4-type zinc finger protein [Rhodobacteraceae bacterium]|nr:TraR/DksA C4-type zinc finger protein [Paracoccaceae bacterium]